MGSVRDYAVVTASYWGFTLTDGALRMLVLLYLNERGYSPLQIASLFLFYEFFGIVTNLVGGWLGARFGLKSTLFAGLVLQITACSMLTVGAALLTVPYVMVAQAISGVAKDLTKMSSKSYVKLVVPDHGLMKWVAILTGSKNTLKGVGFFLGGALLTVAGFQGACRGMAIGLAVVLIFALFMLPRTASRSKVPFRSVLSKDPRINWLSAARFFLFGARDVWFVLALPIYFAQTLGWSSSEVGAFLAIWVIGYGIVQAFAPAHIGQPTARSLARLTVALLVPLAGILGAFQLEAPPTATLTIGLALFGIIFATNSAAHSYLVVAYAGRDKVSLAVGFYYMANASGRLLGTLLSGLVFQAAGLGESGLMACIAVAMILIVLSRVACGPLRAAESAH